MLGRRSFLGLLFALPVAVQQRLHLPPPTAYRPLADERRITTHDGRRYMYLQMQHKVRQGQLVQWSDGSICGVAVGTIDANYYGFVQISNLPRVEVG